MNKDDVKKKVLKAMSEYYQLIPVTLKGQRSRAKKVYEEFLQIEEYDD